MRYGDSHFFIGHQIFGIDIAQIVDDFGAALIAVVFLDLLQFLDDQGLQNCFGTQNLQVRRDAHLDIEQFVQNLLLLHAG